MSENSTGWTGESRAGVDASIRRARRVRNVSEDTGESCPECGYIISAASFPEVCVYCGSSF